MFRRFPFVPLIEGAIPAMFIAFILTFSVDLISDAGWIPDLFFVSFFLGVGAFYRSRFTPKRPSSDFVFGFAVVLTALIVVLAIGRLVQRVAMLLN